MGTTSTEEEIPVEQVADESSVSELMELEESVEFLKVKIANEKELAEKAHEFEEDK